MDERKCEKIIKSFTKVIFEKIRSDAESGALIQIIIDFFAENQDNFYNVNEIFEVAMSPFYSININDSAILLFVNVICNFWVDKGKLQAVKINGKSFYHARNYTKKRKFAKNKKKNNNRN